MNVRSSGGWPVNKVAVGESAWRAAVLPRQRKRRVSRPNPTDDVGQPVAVSKDMMNFGSPHRKARNFGLPFCHSPLSPYLLFSLPVVREM